MGYLLPWGQMSYWGAQVIISLFGAIPFQIGESLMDKNEKIIDGDATKNQFLLRIEWIYAVIN